VLFEAADEFADRVRGAHGGLLYIISGLIAEAAGRSAPLLLSGKRLAL
jgi:hypothetical protein